MTIVTIDGLKFRENSDIYKVYKDFYKNGVTNPQEISQALNIPLKSTQWYILKIKKGLNVTLTQATETTSENTSETTRKDNKLLEIEIKEKEDGLYIYARTCLEYEDYIKNTKELNTTENLFGIGKPHKFYKYRLVDNYLDEINKPIIYLGQINFSILRLKGISNGVEFKIDNLMTDKQIKDGLIKLSSVFKTFYKKNVENIKQNFKLEVLKEDETPKEDDKKENLNINSYLNSDEYLNYVNCLIRNENNEEIDFSYGSDNND